MQNSSRQTDYPGCSGGSGGTGPGYAVPEKSLPGSTQTESQFREVDAMMERLDKAIVVHEEKIESVVRRPTPEAAGDNPAAEEMLVPVASRLRIVAKRLAILSGRLEDLTERVEA